MPISASACGNVPELCGRIVDSEKAQAEFLRHRSRDVRLPSMMQCTLLDRHRFGLVQGCGRRIRRTRLRRSSGRQRSSFAPLDKVREPGAQGPAVPCPRAATRRASYIGRRAINERPPTRRRSRRSIRFAKAGSRTDSARLIQARSSPPSVATRPRVAARSPMSVVSWRATWAAHRARAGKGGPSVPSRVWRTRLGGRVAPTGHGLRAFADERRIGTWTTFSVGGRQAVGVAQQCIVVVSEGGASM
jgi:hypothetical protein